MRIADWFRPKWKHSNAARRAEALRELSADQRDIVVELARHDGDETVRRLAIERLDDPELLASLADAESSRRVGEFAARRAREIWVRRARTADTQTSAHSAFQQLDDVDTVLEIIRQVDSSTIREAAFARLGELGELGRLAREPGELSLRLQAIAGIDEASVLRGLAIAAEPNEVALAAVEALTVVADLDSVAAKARNKHVRARAKRRASELAPERRTNAAAAVEQRERRATELRALAELERLALAGPWNDADSLERLEQARYQWVALNVEDDSLERRFRAAIDEFHRARKQEQEDELRRRRQEKIAAAEMATVSKHAGSAAVESAETRADLHQFETAASVASRDSVPTSDHPNPHVETAKSELDLPPRPSKPAAPDPEVVARRHEANKRRLVQACEELEKLSRPLNRGHAVAALRSAQQAFSRPGALARQEDLRELTQRHDELHERVSAWMREEAEDEKWREWSSLTKQETLAEKAEKLLAEADKHEDLGAALRAIQQEWKFVRMPPGGKGDELWQRFRTACDAVYEKVKVLREAEKAKIAEQLERKVALCQAAEALIDSQDWAETTNKLKALQGEWKAIGVTPRGQDRKLWARFRVATDKFFVRKRDHGKAIEREQAENLARKDAIIDQIEAMLTGIVDEETWERAKRELEPLHRQWKQIGHVPRRFVQSTRDRYHAARERVFGRQAVLNEAEREAREQAKRTAVQEIEALLAQASNEVDELVAGWNRVHDLGDDSLRQRLYARCQERLVENAQVFAKTELALEASLRRKSKLCERLDELAHAADSESAGVAEQLQAALENNALGEPLRDTEGEARTLAVRWQRIGPTPGDEGTELDRRFADACTRLGMSTS